MWVWVVQRTTWTVYAAEGRPRIETLAGEYLTKEAAEKALAEYREKNRIVLWASRSSLDVVKVLSGLSK